MLQTFWLSLQPSIYYATTDDMNISRLFLSVAICLLCNASKASDKTRFDNDWLFHLGDVAEASSPSFNDGKWQKLDLPHDWSIKQNVDRNAPAGNDGGYYPTGIGWYRKTFVAPKSTGKKAWLYFEGVYERSEVYVNGKRVGGHPYGYTSFYCDITEQLKAGKGNVVAVRVDNSQQKNSRWYTGSGIYRHVWLVTSDKFHIENQGVQTLYDVSTSTLTVAVACVDEQGEESRKATIRVSIPGIGTKTLDFNTEKGNGCGTLQFKVDSPKLWSVDTPNIYTATVELLVDGKAIDRVEQTFGLRTIEYSAKEGFKLNGKEMKLNGCCVHHDNGILGAAAFDRAEHRRAELIKAAGFNAVRTSHNPPSPAFLDACDEIGLLVIDEAFDGWRDAKNKHDYSTLFDEWWENDVQAMVKRDRNHPSIFCWSVGNEVIERKKLEVVTTAHKLRMAVRSCDPEARPVTSALAAWDSDWEIYDPLAAESDIVGYNYMMHKAESDHKRMPERVMMQTESYPNDAFKNWERMFDNEYIIGDFVWTGMDYIGESGIGRWWYKGETPGEHYQHDLYPWHGSYCGDIDLIGFRKPISHYRDILHGTAEKMYMAVYEPNAYKGDISVGLWGTWPAWRNWNWPGHEGKDIDVVVYSRHASVRLSLNGKVVGEKPTTRAEQFKAVFTLPYTAGELKAEGMENGEVVETQTLKTAGDPATLRATTDRTEIASDGQDLAFVTVEVLDSEGNVVPNAACPIEAAIKGAAAIEATGNADLQDSTAYSLPQFKSWKGRALVVVRSGRKAGSATLTLSSPKLPAATVKLRTKKP